MKLLTYEKDGLEQAGVLAADGYHIYPLSEAGIACQTMNEWIVSMDEQQKKDLAQLAASGRETLFCLDNVNLKAPIPVPAQDIICLGVNYLDHAEESARYKAEAFGGERSYAVYFSKRTNYAIGDGALIDSHQDLVDSLDYESELAVIIGREVKNVKEEDVADCIFGYTIMNDVSARNVQLRHKQWYFGKSLDGFTALGPWIVTAEEIAFPPKLDIYAKVNGELRQSSNTELLIFGVAHAVSELSQGMTLKPGTILSMGTPAGVGMGFTPPRFLKPGDVVECGIEKIGTLTNTVK